MKYFDLTPAMQAAPHMHALAEEAHSSAAAYPPGMDPPPSAASIKAKTFGLFVARAQS
jgi:hypothetical protein